MGKIAEDCNLDVERAERARALHRVVRAMHDGHCPKCGHLGPAEDFYLPAMARHSPPTSRTSRHTCPSCGFTILGEVAESALAEFRPFLQKSVLVFEDWERSRRSQIFDEERSAGHDEEEAATLKAKRLCLQFAPVGSRVTCDPPPTNTDVDFLCHVVDKDEFIEKAEEIGFKLGVGLGSRYAGRLAGPTTSPFAALRFGNVNLIVTDDGEFFGLFMLATRLAKKFNLRSKEHRVDLFQAILYKNG